MISVAAISYTEVNGISQCSFGADEDFIPEKEIHVELGVDEPVETDRTLENIFKEAQENGMKKDGIEKLRFLALKYKPIFE